MVVGAGYIAVELAGILKTLGSEVHQFIRNDKVKNNCHKLIKINFLFFYSRIFFILFFTFVSFFAILAANLIIFFFFYKLLFLYLCFKTWWINLMERQSIQHILGNIFCYLAYFFYFCILISCINNNTIIIIIS